MRLTKKFACLSTLAITAAAVAGGSTYRWDEGHRQYTPWHDNNACALQLVDVYQPEGGSQPIHLKVKNVSHNRLQYTLALAVDGRGAGVFNVDNANPGEISDRDSSQRYPGTLANSRIAIRVTSCSIRS